MAAAAITLALNLAAQYGPAVITFIKQIRQKDGNVVTSVTILAKLDAADAQFEDNLKADADWFAAHGLGPEGEVVSAPAAQESAGPGPVVVPNPLNTI